MSCCRKASLFAPHGTVARVRSRSGWANWCFVPFVHSVPKATKRRIAADDWFRKSGSGSSFEALILQAMQTAGGRRKLREFYAEEDLGGANAISMSLYMGPLSGQSRELLANSQGLSYRRRCRWLVTGDAELQHYGPA